MFRDIWTLFLPVLAVSAVVIAIGTSLQWSEDALGWSISGAGAIVVAIWTLTRPRERSR